MDVDSLATELDGRAADGLFSGAALVWADGAAVFEHHAGLAHRGHGVPVTPSTRFVVASIAKIVTAATALRLVERGLLALDQPLLEVLPAEHRPAALTSAHTLHHLLSHTSGLTNYHDDDDDTPASFESCWTRVAPQVARGPADLLPLFADLPASDDPGVAYSYADVNYLLVGLAIEAVTGRSFAAVADDEVCRPAGMTSSGFLEVDLDPPGLATGYLLDEDRTPPQWRSNAWSLPVGGMPDGGLTTTCTDLARLLDALRQGTLLDPETWASMCSPQFPGSTELEQYGYGLELTIEDDQVVIFGHSGQDPGVSTILSHYVDAAVTTVVLCNQDSGSWPVSCRLAEAFALPEPRD